MKTMAETIPEKLNKIHKSVLFCMDDEGNMCEQCPYYRANSNDDYICIDKRNEDFIHVLNWVESCIDMFEKLVGKK